MTEYYRMAEKGRVYLFGDGQYRANPIHGEDLAAVCVDALETDAANVPVGGPETLSQRDIALAAFAALGKPPKISCIPDWVRLAVLKGSRVLTGERVYGPLEFFLTVMAMDMVAPAYGRHRLGDYFAGLAGKPAH
jgi:nucleoside-diphosphate-sugar epimerase